MNPWCDAPPKNEGPYWFAGKFDKTVMLLDVFTNLDGELVVTKDGDEIPVADFQAGWWSPAEVPVHPGGYLE